MQAGLPVSGEWLESDGLGGYAMGTPTGIRRRKYHGLLVSARTPPTRRVMLVSAVEAWLEDGTTRVPLSSHRYERDVVHPDGAERIESFSLDPWPRWTYLLADGTRVVHDVLMAPGAPRVVLTWRVLGAVKPLTLFVRPLLACRDHHAVGRERPLELRAERRDGRCVFRPEPDLPAIVALANGTYEDVPVWYRDFVYEDERARGYEAVEDLASPGVFRFDLLGREAALVFSAGGEGLGPDDNAAGLASQLKLDEAKRRGAHASAHHRAADAYLVRRGDGLSVVAGYPWFTDWGRDTFIAVRGLCLATGRFDEARRILETWAGVIDDGMVPNRFGEGDGRAEPGAVDASLWFVVAAGALLERVRLAGDVMQRLLGAIEAVVGAYLRGTRFGIAAARDGLLACGVQGLQLTWMDAKVGDWVVTPRVGKPVEVQALWINALAIAARLWHRFEEPLARARAAFDRRFWHAPGGYLYDVVDVDHEPGKVDPSFRPNQLFAVGGLPLAVSVGPRARRIVDLAEARLWTPAGPRSLAPGEPGYLGKYEGGPRERDAAYHQGSVWPYLAGAFIEAWVRVHGDGVAARREARNRFFTPLMSALDPNGSGHLPELADADPPHLVRGCPFQAWSLAEALRLDLEVLATPH